MFADVLSALARRSLLAEKLTARVYAPTEPAPYPVPVAALALAPNGGDGLVIRGTDGAYAVAHRVTRIGAVVIVLATVFASDGHPVDRVDQARTVADYLPGVARVGGVVGRWTLTYPVSAGSVTVGPVPRFALKNG